jgi:hypothetical protein
MEITVGIKRVHALGGVAVDFEENLSGLMAIREDDRGTIFSLW